MPVIDPAITANSMGQNTPIVPKPTPTPASDTPAPSINAMPSNVPATAQASPASTALPNPPKESFMEGAQREINPQYTTDAEGTVIRSEPARTQTRKSILGSVLFGALEGAVRGMSAPTPEGAKGSGAAFSAGMDAAMKGQIATDNRARLIAQQNFENQRKAAQDKLDTNLKLAQIAHFTQLMNFEKKEEPGVLLAKKYANDAAVMKLQAGQLAMLETFDKLQKNLVAGGLDPKFLQLYTEHSGQLNAQVPSLVSGGAVALQNGQRGSNNGVFIVPSQILKDTLIPKGVHLLYDTYGETDAQGKLVPGSIARTKDGTPIPGQQALTGDGKTTLWDYYNAAMSGFRNLYQDQQQTMGNLAREKAQADIKKKNQAKDGTGGEADDAMVDAIGTGKMDLSRLDYLASRNPQLLAKVAQKYPEFDSSKVKSYVNIYKDYTSGKTSIALNSGATALKHMLELRALNTNESRNPLSADYKAFNNKLDTLVGELVRFYGMPDTDKSVKSLRETLGGWFNRDAAITSQARSMADKFASYVQQWRNAAPSKAYEAPMPHIDAQAVKSLLTLDPEFQTQYPDILLTATNPQTQQKIYSLDGGKSWQQLPQ